MRTRDRPIRAGSRSRRRPRRRRHARPRAPMAPRDRPAPRRRYPCSRAGRAPEWVQARNRDRCGRATPRSARRWSRRPRRPDGDAGRSHLDEAPAFRGRPELAQELLAARSWRIEVLRALRGERGRGDEPVLARDPAHALGEEPGDAGAQLEARAAAAARVEYAPVGAGHLTLDGQLLRIHVVGAPGDVGGRLAEIESLGGEHGEVWHHLEEGVDHDLIEAHPQAADLAAAWLIVVRLELAVVRAEDHPAALGTEVDVTPVRDGGRVDELHLAACRRRANDVAALDEVVIHGVPDVRDLVKAREGWHLPTRRRAHEGGVASPCGQHDPVGAYRLARHYLPIGALLRPTLQDEPGDPFSLAEELHHVRVE